MVSIEEKDTALHLWAQQLKLLALNGKLVRPLLGCPPPPTPNFIPYRLLEKKIYELALRPLLQSPC